MFQETIIEIIERVESLTQKKRSIVELDIENIKEEIQETLFNINFTPDTINDINLDGLEKFSVLPQEALGLFFLTFVTTLRHELSYNSFWVGIEDALLEFEEDNNTFFVDNYFDDSEPNDYLNQAIVKAICRFNLRDGYDNGKPTDTILLQMGILNRFTNINYWLTSTSKNSIIKDLTDRTNENYSNTFSQGWKVIKGYSQGLLSRKDTVLFLKKNVWFKDFDIDDLLGASKVSLHTPLISTDEIESNFFLETVKYEDEKLQFTINGDDFFLLNLKDSCYGVLINNEIEGKLLKDDSTGLYTLQESIVIVEPDNYKIKLEIKDNANKLVHQEDFILFDFNHDILVFDEDGKWCTDQNRKLDDSKVYCVLIDSDFDLECDEDNVHEYFDGYVHLISDITNETSFKADDGDEYQFSLNFTEQIKTPIWLNNIELYAQSDFLSFDEPIQYKLKYNNITVSARKTDELIDIKHDATIVRWSYSGGVVYDLDNIVDFNYDMDLTYDILLNRKNTIKIKVGDYIFTKQLNVTLVEKTIKPRYRTFLKDADDNISFLKETNRLTTNDLNNNQIIITSFHEDFVKEPEQKIQILRDKSNIYNDFEINKAFTLTNYPYYGEEISSVKKVYDDIRWNTFCSVSMNGNVKNYDEKQSIANLHDDTSKELTLIVLDNSYTLKTTQVDTSSNKILIPKNTIGFCLVDNGNYIGSYFIEKSLDIETVFSNLEVLKFLRFSYYPFAEHFNGTEYEKNRALREKARNEKKKDKRLFRSLIKSNSTLFLSAFLEDELVLDETTLNMNFDHSKAITEQILYAIEFDVEESTKIIHDIILNRWQDKVIALPMFLLYLLNKVKSDRYYQIFLDELNEEITTPTDVDEEFINRMIKALLSDHKIDRFEKINIKTVTQKENKDFYIKVAIDKIIEIANTPIEEDTATEEE